jgi:hypothetical protein
VSACPFRLCNAEIRHVPEREQPGAAPTALVRIPQHPLGGHEELGLCPASLLLIPLSDYDVMQLEEQAGAIERILRGRNTPTPPPGSPELPVPHGDWDSLNRPREPYRPGRVARPDPNPYWFRQGPGQGTQAGHGGYTAPPPMEQVLLPPTSPVRDPAGFIGPEAPPSTTTSTGGTTGVSSVEEVRAAISAAGEVCTQVSSSLSGLASEAGTALATLNTVRETSVDPLGAPQVAAAIERIEEANALLLQAIEIGNIYKGTL